VVLLHGLGADENDLWDLRDLFPSASSVVSLRAPLRYGLGFQWFEIDWSSRTFIADLGEIASSARQIIESIGAAPAVLVGFSQGGIMAQAVATSYPDQVAGIALLSTWPLPDVSFSSGPVLIQHGNQDPVIPVAASTALQNVFLANGSLETYDMAHGICMDSAEGLSDWYGANFLDGS
jgi:phospholipase/carboxylesterase